ncbi:MAG: hypothetical protein ABIH89_06705 [Elusimicrobiota bacterium]
MLHKQIPGIVSDKYLFVDQAMSFLGMTNYLTGGSIISHYMSDAISESSRKFLEQEILFS